MNLLILKGFNNYFNRIIKRYSTLADYKTHSDSYYDFSNINFNPNDGVTTTQVLGSTTQQQAGGPDLVPLAWEHDGNPDYLIAYETEQVGIATNTVIRSRWFITESVRTRNGQYNLKLKRDSIADHLETLLSCPAFIKKGTVSDDNPLIVNSEGITVNQIKSGETLLKDKTGSAWIVGYMAKNAPAATITEQIPDETIIEYETIEDIADEFGVSASDLSNILTTNKENPSYFIADNIEFVGWLNYVDLTSREGKIIAGSQNFLSSITYGSGTTYGTNNDSSDFFAKIHYEGSAQIGEVGTSGAVTLEDAIKYAGKHWWTSAIGSQINSIKAQWKTFTNNPFFTNALYVKLKNMSENRTLIYKGGKYYIIQLNGSSGPTNTAKKYPVSAAGGVMGTACNDFVNTFNNNEPHDAWWLERLAGGNVYINYNEITAKFYLEEVTADSDVPAIDITMSSTRNSLQEQPYDMFAIPFNNTKLIINSKEYEVVGSYAQKIAMKLVESLTSANIYDVQLLPYCPIPEIIDDGGINITSLTSNYDYDLIYKTQDEETFVSDTVTPDFDPLFNEYDASWENLEKPAGTATLTNADINVIYSNENHTSQSIIISEQTASSVNIIVSFEVIDPDGEVPTVTISWSYTPTEPIPRTVIIYPKSNSFSVALDYNLSLKETMKIDSQTDLYRLVSPNYQGSFDFNVAKNGGAVNGFVADCTYKPYTPYIKVAPNFAWLYGTNYGDCRGLICGGDFSIGIINSAWENFQLQNKNYQNIFNREIQNLDVNQSIQRTQQYVSGGLNIVRDTIAGGVAGGLATGSPYGAIAGAVVGGIGSGVGYGIDMNLMERGLQEQRQFSIDKFKMQLGNIQALPYTLTKVGAFNINSKVWPFLEYYTCSEQEKEALKMKIQYEGMTVGIVDYLGNYMSGGYVQADLIRNESIIEDSHLLDDIYIELTKGVYM